MQEYVHIFMLKQKFIKYILYIEPKYAQFIHKTIHI